MVGVGCDIDAVNVVVGVNCAYDVIILQLLLLRRRCGSFWLC